MKYAFCIFCTLAILTLGGCARSTYSYGKDFSTEKVSSIVNGETTKAELLQLFGAPFSKTVLSGNQEKWLYTFSEGTAEAQSYIVTMKVNTTGTMKTLDILLEEGVVINFSYNETENPYKINTN